jgi:hypothetical protein
LAEGPMEIFYDIKEHYKYLISEVGKNPKSVIITSYGIYAGITQDGRDSTEWGDKYHLYSRDLFDSISDIQDVRIIIGVPDYRSCKGSKPCEDCEISYVASLIKIYNHAEKFSGFKWRISTSSHLKSVLFIHDDAGAKPKISGVIGGRNLNDSTWFDASYTIDGERAMDLCKRVLNYYKQCPPASLDALNDVLMLRGIKQSTITKMINA